MSDRLQKGHGQDSPDSIPQTLSVTIIFNFFQKGTRSSRARRLTIQVRVNVLRSTSEVGNSYDEVDKRVNALVSPLHKLLLSRKASRCHPLIYSRHMVARWDFVHPLLGPFVAFVTRVVVVVSGGGAVG